MTATMWLNEEPGAQKLEAPQELNCEEHRSAAEPTELLGKGSFELLSDFSEDESEGNSRIKTIANKASNSSKALGPPGQPTLFQCGFSKLFEVQCKAVKDNGGNNVSLDESSDEQSITNDINCQENPDSFGTLKQNFGAVRSPLEKCVLLKNEKILEQNTSFESNGEKKFKNIADLYNFQDATESDESDVIFPTQYTIGKKATNNQKLKPLMDSSEDSETENSIEIRNSGDDRYTNVRGENMPLKPLMKRKSTNDISDESDDIEISPKTRVRKQRSTRVLKFKRNRESKRELKIKKTNPVYTSECCNSQDTDDNLSSDDSSASYINFSEQNQRPKTVKERMSFSSKLSTPKKKITFLPRKSLEISNKTVTNQEQICESMDKLLDGVQEVAYIHSNQNVIGSSKAENHMSHWAARDVFELKQFSQLPANIAVGTSKTYKEKRKVDALTRMKKDQQSNEENISLPIFLLHPICQKKKKIYRTEQTTFIIGETPKGIRRKQFEEMASFNLSSVKEFAECIANATSEERQKMLRDFHASQHLEIREFLMDFASEVTKFTNKEGSNVRNKSGKKESLIKDKFSEFKTMSHKDSAKKNSPVCNQEVYQGKSKFQDHGSCREGLYNVAEIKKSSVNSNHKTDSENANQVSKRNVPSCSPSSKTEAYERKFKGIMKHQQALRTDIPRKEQLSKVENKKIENAGLENTSVVHLLGDTSVLEDLFKSHQTNSTQLPKKILSGPLKKTTQRPKDFWDILNEQNDDSLSQLTDLAVIETLCEKVPLSTSSKRKEELQTSLWKSNENFLWKKMSSSDEVENTTNIKE